MSFAGHFLGNGFGDVYVCVGGIVSLLGGNVAHVGGRLRRGALDGYFVA